MSKILILFAHPRLEKSRINSGLISGIENIAGVTFHDLYEAYPDYDVNVKFEQDLVSQNDIIVWQHPFYWYSCPALTKQWIDLVLQHNWAYGRNGKALVGKKAFNVITTGGRYEAYQKDGMHKRTIGEFLYPFNQTARLCNMSYYPPFVVHKTHLLTNEEIHNYNEDYKRILELLVNDSIQEEEILNKLYLNDILKQN